MWLWPDFFEFPHSQVPPLLAFKIDIKADLEKASDLCYIHRKMQKLLDFGTKKVFWILTETRQVIVAEAGQPAVLTVDWDQDVAFQAGLKFNIGAYLRQHGISAD